MLRRYTQAFTVIERILGLYAANVAGDKAIFTSGDHTSHVYLG